MIGRPNISRELIVPSKSYYSSSPDTICSTSEQGRWKEKGDRIDQRWYGMENARCEHQPPKVSPIDPSQGRFKVDRWPYEISSRTKKAERRRRRGGRGGGCVGGSFWVRFCSRCYTTFLHPFDLLTTHRAIMIANPKWFLCAESFLGGCRHKRRIKNYDDRHGR